MNGQWGGDEARERSDEEREDEVGKFGELRVSWEGGVWKRGGVDDKVGAVCGV